MEAEFDPNIMQLNDNCVADQVGLARLRIYRTSYREVAEEMGVRLATEDNLSKAFPLSIDGEILGLLYDGEMWTWKMPRDKSD